jgi:hypothetical protein
MTPIFPHESSIYSLFSRACAAGRGREASAYLLSYYDRSSLDSTVLELFSLGLAFAEVTKDIPPSSLQKAARSLFLAEKVAYIHPTHPVLINYVPLTDEHRKRIEALPPILMPSEIPRLNYRHLRILKGIGGSFHANLFAVPGYYPPRLLSPKAIVMGCSFKVPKVSKKDGYEYVVVPERTLPDCTLHHAFYADFSGILSLPSGRFYHHKDFERLSGVSLRTCEGVA